MSNSQALSTGSGVMHYIMHNFGDWEIETKHMTRVQKSVYLDMRTNYLKGGKPFTSDIELLEHRLSCRSDDDKQALELILKDKFKLDKRSKTYKHPSWDRILKNYRSKHWDDDIKNLNGTNVTTKNDGIEDNTPLTAAERKAKSRAKEQEMRKYLTGARVDHKGVKGLKELTKLYNQHLDDAKLSCNEVTVSHTECHTIGTQKEAINSNPEHETNNQITIEREAHTQNTDRSNSSISANSYTCPSTDKGDLATKDIGIENWTSPSIDIMRERLLQEDLKLDMTEKKYVLELENFKAYYSDKARQGKPLTTENLRITRWHQWLKREIENNKTIDGNKEKVKERFNIDNEAWPANKLTDQNAKQFMGDGYHPSHSCPQNNSSKFNPKTEVVLNGCRKAVLPEMTSDETYAYIDKHQAAGESKDETYDRLVSAGNCSSRVDLR
ncbi:DUF1376 domain-containing protein [Psychrobacter lutiphocae]|uniref:DUF1376 domain-containing protein n=1 Tax=Psychrobacter lutiphocae TaxID=540500 RepID=UPI0003812536|nr:DUF1376 domain-containing protein [Psychrobacter lutiphocae]